jgi:hypothetical protein
MLRHMTVSQMFTLRDDRITKVVFTLGGSPLFFSLCFEIPDFSQIHAEVPLKYKNKATFVGMSTLAPLS